MAVDPDYFVNSMRDRWEGQYGLKSGEPLQAAWREMAVTFNAHIEGQVLNEWSVLRLPTGTGKTQGLALYCSILSEQEDHPGVLIITRFTVEIDELISKINEPPYQPSALADHSGIKEEDRPSKADLQSAPVVAITHNMYQRSLNAAVLNENKVAWWEKYTGWDFGTRKLVVIDESIDVVKSVEVDIDTLRMVRGWIPRALEKNEPERIKAFDQIIAIFLEWDKEDRQDYYKEDIKAEYWKNINIANLIWLRNELCKLELSQIILKRADPKNYYFYRCSEFFSDLFIILTNDSWHTVIEGIHAVSTSYVTLPTDLNNAVIMDATAGQNYAYELLGAIPVFRPLPPNVRNYQNLKLHIFYGYQNSKDFLSLQDEKYFLQVLNNLNPMIDEKKQFLLCTNLTVEQEKLGLVKSHYSNCDIAHWGDLDGKNKWQDYDTMVIHGLQRLSVLTAESIILAFENWHKKTERVYAAPDQEFSFDPETRETNIEIFDNFVESSDYMEGHVVATIIQAINRIRCRKVIDEAGNCQEANVYIFFDKGNELERAILRGIREEMPHIQIIEGEIPARNKIALNKREKATIQFFENVVSGKYYIKDLIQQLPLASRTMDRVISAFKETDSLFGQRMRELGVSYDEDMGKLAKPCFVKADGLI